MNNIIAELQVLVSMVQENMPFVLALLLGLWLINLVNAVLHYRLNILGIYPRSWHGVIGIFVSPFLHGNFNHLFFNSIPLFVFANFVLLAGHRVFYCVSSIVIVISGVGIWLFGRRALHVGASGLIMGYWGYLLVNAIQTPSVVTIIIAFVSLYYFGGLFLALFPQKVEVSWEGHVFGFLGGLAAVYLCPILLR